MFIHVASPGWKRVTSGKSINSDLDSLVLKGWVDRKDYLMVCKWISENEGVFLQASQDQTSKKAVECAESWQILFPRTLLSTDFRLSPGVPSHWDKEVAEWLKYLHSTWPIGSILFIPYGPPSPTRSKWPMNANSGVKLEHHWVCSPKKRGKQKFLTFLPLSHQMVLYYVF